MEKHDKDNRSRQLNSNNDAFWKSRGEEGRPVPAEGPSESAPDAKPAREKKGDR